MAAEVLQLAGVLVVFVVVALLWLRIVYLPGRTLENWEDQWSDRRTPKQGDEV